MKRLLLLALAVAVPAHGEIIPQSSGGDSRILSASYDPDQVVVLRVAPQTALAVEFSPGEHIENVAIGTSAGWQVTPNNRGDHLFVKSSTEAVPTNLIVVTDARQYLFSLVIGDNSVGLAPYILRFTYPSHDAAIAGANSGPILYRLYGSREIRPRAMSDDGVATRINWADDVPIPAIYTVDKLGHESLVNGAMRDGAFVVDAIAPKLIFRSGKFKAWAVRKIGKGK